MINPTCTSENLLFTTVRIAAKYEDGISGTGTGFIFNYKDTERQLTIPSVITNKHVIHDNKHGRAILGMFALHAGMQSGEAIIPCDESVSITIEGFESRWYRHQNAKVDLCAMPLLPILNEFQKTGKKPFFRSLDESCIPTDEELSSLFAIEEIILIGYPIGLFDCRNNLPIIRKGITASHPAIDFEGYSNGVVDAGCFPGSSGSPILICNEGSYQTKHTLHAGLTRLMLLGVLHSGPVVRRDGTKVVEVIPTTEEAAAVSWPIHLGYYAKSKEILELGRQMFIDYGRKGML